MIEHQTFKRCLLQITNRVKGEGFFCDTSVNSKCQDGIYSLVLKVSDINKRNFLATRVRSCNYGTSFSQYGTFFNRVCFTCINTEYLSKK